MRKTDFVQRRSGASAPARRAGWMVIASVVVGCASAPSPPEHAPPSPSGAVTQASASEPPARTCPEAPLIPPGKDRASIVLQDGHTSMVVNLELSADGRMLASTGLDGTVRLWDTRSGLQLRRLQSMGAALATSLSAAGDALAFLRTDSASRVGVATVALAAGAEPRQLDAVGAFHLAADGKTIAVGYQELRIEQPDTGVTLATLHPFTPKARAPAGATLDPAYDYHAIRAVAFDPRGGRLAVASGLEIAFVDTATWKVVLRRPHGLGLPAGAVGAPAVVAGAPKAWAIPGSDPKQIHPGWFPSSLLFAGDALVIVSPMGARIVSAQDGGSPRPTIPGALSAAVLGDALLTTDAMEHVSAWSLATGAPMTVPGLDALVGSKVAVSADGATIALSANSTSIALRRAGLAVIRIIDGRTLKVLRSIEPRLASVDGVAVRPDGRVLAVASRDGSLALWSLTTGELTSLTPGALGLRRSALDWDDAGERLVLTGGARLVRLHDGATGRLLRQWEPTGQFLVHTWFLPGGGAVATLDGTGRIDVWDVSAKVPAQPPRDVGDRIIARPKVTSTIAIPGPITAAAVSPDRLRIAAISDDRMLTTPDPTHAQPYKEVYSEANVLDADTATGVVRWSTRVVGGYTDKWVGFAPDGASVLLSTMADSRGMLSVQASKRAVPADLLRVFDGATGALTRTETVETVGPIASASGAIALGGRFPEALAFPSFAAHRLLGPDTTTLSAAPLGKGAGFVLGGDSGAATLFSAAGEVTAILASAGGGEYMAATPDGIFRASIDGARNVAWTFDQPLDAFTFEQFAARFDRPALLAARLAGSAAPAPATIARPPRVTIARPASPLAPILTRSTVVRAHVTSAGRVDRVRAFVNGRPAGEALVCAKEGDVAIEVPIPFGRSRIALIASDAEGFAGNPEVLDVRSAATAAAAPNLWAVAIGVSAYPNLAKDYQLAFADDDARAITAALRAEVGPGRPFGALRDTTLIDAQVTVESVTRALEGLAAMEPDDLAVVFLAGHGVSLDDDRMVYLTSEASLSRESARSHGVGWSVIQAALGRARGRVVVLLDACHAGHVSTDLVAPNESLAQALSAEGRSGVLIFAAARGSQLSYEVPEGRAALGGSRGLELAWEGKPTPRANLPAGGHGLFTSALLEALGGDAPDADRSGAVEVGELIDYVTERVKGASNGQQTPWVARREMFGDFVIAPAVRAPAPSR